MNYSLPTRRMGKTLAMERALAQFLKRHPRAVIARVLTDGEVIYEKPVDGEEITPFLY